jgi:hypothetical protein
MALIWSLSICSRTGSASRKKGKNKRNGISQPRHASPNRKLAVRTLTELPLIKHPRSKETLTTVRWPDGGMMEQFCLAKLKGAATIHKDAQAARSRRGESKLRAKQAEDSTRKKKHNQIPQARNTYLTNGTSEHQHRSTRVPSQMEGTSAVRQTLASHRH